MTILAWPQVPPFGAGRAKFPAGVATDYAKAHEAVAQAASACAALFGAYRGAQQVSDLADILVDLFEDGVGDFDNDQPRISDHALDRIEDAIKALDRSVRRAA